MKYNFIYIVQKREFKWKKKRLFPECEYTWVNIELQGAQIA